MRGNLNSRFLVLPISPPAPRLGFFAIIQNFQDTFSLLESAGTLR